MPVTEFRDVAPIGPFTFRWPEGEEAFERGWTGHVVAGGTARRFRYGLGKRQVYGRHRVHSVVWINGQPVAEGVAADDYEHTAHLISRIKGGDRKVVRALADLPPGLDGLTVVQHRDEIDAPHSPTCLAVKIAEDDVEGWVRFALSRATRSASAPRTPTSATAMTPVRSPAMLPDDRQAAPATKVAVARELIAFEERSNGPLRQGIVPFTTDPEAERFVRENDFAFLLAVIFDQGVPYEQAWRAPLLLRDRLGHLDPGRIAEEADSVARAIAIRPTLHRYINKMPRWVSAAGARVMTEYGGDAGAIWRGGSAAHVRDRLDAFVGISQKKAAMALMLLWRNRNEPIRDMESCDVAVDIHLRRVFLRTGLVDRDSPGDMIAIARTLNPVLPGALDPPAWAIGRGWCHPQIPDCDACPLGQVCPRFVSRAHGVNGA